MSLRDPPYEPPSVSELQEFLLADRQPTGHVNQVWPNLYIGNEVAARDMGTLHSLGITHIVNAAHRSHNPSSGSYLFVNTGPRFYRDMAVDYYGVEADDAIDFILSPFFYPTARYIRAALAMGGRVFVHCLMGVSRSATLVLAFLMIVEGLRLQEAVAAVRPHRDICPNPGFLQQLRSLDMGLERERRRQQQAKTLAVARDKTQLSSLGVTHILNAAAGQHRINTGQQFYEDLEVEYYGVEAADHPEFNLQPFFRPAAQFMDMALKKNGQCITQCKKQNKCYINTYKPNQRNQRITILIYCELGSSFISGYTSIFTCWGIINNLLYKVLRHTLSIKCVKTTRICEFLLSLCWMTFI
ncbi:dual specificity phosphatase 29-like isoform X3 [Channa argus]|uniref:dual specificity phosphatase 29-like isoform X3 n=1 Tax=Channa argus TaxID=215402 RepID=UPI003522D836